MPKLIADEPKSGKKTRVKTLRALGMTCGIGSMLVGARQAGFEVVGNIEWRRYYHYKDSEGRSTFTGNFPEAFMVDKIEDLTGDQRESIQGIDLAIGHPECGIYSQMQGCNNFRPGATRKVKPTDPGDIPLFIDTLAEIRPRFFVMDDLPKSFMAFPIEEYARRLPDYDLFPEWISNYHYGNIQRQRKRLFMIGALKSERFVFVPGEVENELTLADVIGDLPVDPDYGEIPNHDYHAEGEPAGRALHMDHLWHRPTYGDLRQWFADRPEGTVFEYHSTSGGIKKKPGWYKQRWDGPCAVIDGGSGHTHPIRNLPFTIRERARIQGFPDDFIFYGTRLNEDGEWNHEKNIHMVKQTGKAMPVQFCRYVSEQISAHTRGEKFESSGERLIKPNEYVDGAKRWYCSNVGYADQAKACSSCWMFEACSIRTEKYGIGESVVEPSPRVEPTRPRNPRTVRTTVDRTPVRSVPTKIVRFDKGPGSGTRVPEVEIDIGTTPDDYHCDCEYCSEVIGEIRPSGGGYYSRLDRRKYYDKIESGRGGHAAKTPLHVARWAVQSYSKPGDWVLDPTAGAGTTIVESLVQGRNAAGMEIQYEEIISANVSRHAGSRARAVIGMGDARNLGRFLSDAGIPPVSLVVNNPPYSGDEHWTTFNVSEEKAAKGQWTDTFGYDQQLPNLAFLDEGDEYWSTMESIYRASVDHLVPGGTLVIAVKDMMRNKKPFMLHRMLCEVLSRIDGLRFVGTAFLRHHPPTLHLSTYGKMYGVEPPKYQTINIFRKRRSK